MLRILRIKFGPPFVYSIATFNCCYELMGLLHGSDFFPRYNIINDDVRHLV